MFRLLNAYRTRHTGYFLPKIEIRDKNIMIDGRNLSDFTENLNWGWNGNDNTTISFIIEEVKGSILDFSHGTVRILWLYLLLI